MIQRLTLLLFSLCSIFSIKAQTEDELIYFTGRICKTDSIKSLIGFIEEGDSVLTYNFMTPDYGELGAPLYEFDGFKLNFNVNSQLLFSDRPYGKIYVVEQSKNAAKVVLQLAGAGDRIASGEWIYSEYGFQKSKGGRWFLTGVNYVYEEFDPKKKKSKKKKKKA